MLQRQSRILLLQFGNYQGLLFVVWNWTPLAAVVAIMPILACIMIPGCGNPVVVLDISAPPVATAGASFAITVTAIANGNRDRIFNSPVRFKRTDAAAALPLITLLR